MCAIGGSEDREDRCSLESSPLSSSKMREVVPNGRLPLPPFGLRFPPFPVHSLLSSSLCFLLRSLKLVGLRCGNDALHPNFNGRMLKLYLRPKYYCVSLHVATCLSCIRCYLLSPTWILQTGTNTDELELLLRYSSL